MKLPKKKLQTLLLQGGCKLFSARRSMGAPTACEAAGVPNVSYNGSTVESCPNTFIVSSAINWAPYMEYIINCAMNGDKIDTDWVGDISTNSVVLSDINTAAAAEGTAEKLAEVKEELENGTLHVFDVTKFTVDGKQLSDDHMADVDTDADYTPDTKVVINGISMNPNFVRLLILT